MKIVAIVQARTGSTRLPGKVLMKINGRTVLEHCVARLKKAKKINEIVIATTVKTVDDAIEKLAAGLKIKCFRGSETDVLSRYIGAAESVKADLIVRITSDCPLIDPYVVDAAIEKHLAEKNDYTYNNVAVSMFPRGLDVEIFSLALLKKVSSITADPYYSEHVSNYFAGHPKKFKVGVLMARGAFRRPDVRLCIDTEADFKRVERVLNAKNAKTEGIIKLFDKPKIAFVGMAGPDVGTGHVTRPVSIASMLSDRIDCKIKFYINDSPLTEKVRKLGYDTEPIPLCGSKEEYLGLLADLRKADNDFWVVDLLNITDADVKSIGANNVAIDEAYTKPEKAVMGRDFFPSPRKISKEVKSIIVTFGGSDPNRATAGVLDELNKIDKKLDVIVVIGSLFGDKKNLQNVVKRSKHKIDVIEDAVNMAGLMRRADIAIASAGTTAYELAIVGTPAILIPQVPHQRVNATDLEKRGIAICANKNLSSAIKKIMDYELRKKMSAAGMKQIKNDAVRIVDDVIKALIPAS